MMKRAERRSAARRRWEARSGIAVCSVVTLVLVIVFWSQVWLYLLWAAVSFAAGGELAVIWVWAWHTEWPERRRDPTGSVQDAVDVGRQSQTPVDHAELSDKDAGPAALAELGPQGVIRGRRRRTAVPEPLAPRPPDLADRDHREPAGPAAGRRHDLCPHLVRMGVRGLRPGRVLPGDRRLAGREPHALSYEPATEPAEAPESASRSANGRSSSGSPGTTRNGSTPHSTTCRPPRTNRTTGEAGNQSHSPPETRSPDSAKLGAAQGAPPALFRSGRSPAWRRCPGPGRAGQVASAGVGMGMPVLVSAAWSQATSRVVALAECNAARAAGSVPASRRGCRQFAGDGRAFLV
jgi:hypothetical protein